MLLRSSFIMAYRYYTIHTVLIQKCFFSECLINFLPQSCELELKCECINPALNLLELSCVYKQEFADSIRLGIDLSKNWGKDRPSLKHSEWISEETVVPL